MAEPEVKTFDEILALAQDYKSNIGDIESNRNWVELHGLFTPELLRGIATEIERQYGNKNRHL